MAVFLSSDHLTGRLSRPIASTGLTIFHLFLLLSQLFIDSVESLVQVVRSEKFRLAGFGFIRGCVVTVLSSLVMESLDNWEFLFIGVAG